MDIEKKKIRRLKKLKIDEVSWVDRPANQIPFLFVKSVDGDENENEGEQKTKIDKQELDLDVNVITKGTVGSTTVKVNGKEVKELMGFTMALYPYGEYEESSVGAYCTYTVSSKGEANGGFKSTRTYTLSKNLKLKEELDKDKANKAEEAEEAEEADLTALGEFMGEDCGQEVIEKQLAKALISQIEVIKNYFEDLPMDLKESIKNVVKLASYSEAVDIVEINVNKEENMSNEGEKTTEDSKVNQTKETQTFVLSEEQMGVLASKVAEKLKETPNVVPAPKEEKKVEPTKEEPKEEAKVAEEEEVSAADLGRQLSEVLTEVLQVD